MSEAAPVSSRKEYPPQLTWAEASNLIKLYVHEHRLQEILDIGLQTAKDDEQDAKEALRLAKQTSRFSKEEIFLPKTDWYIQRVQSERKRLAALSKVVEGLEKGKVPEHRSWTRGFLELIGGTAGGRKVDNLFVPKGVATEAPLATRDQLEHILEGVRKAVRYNNPEAFMHDSFVPPVEETTKKEEAPAPVAAKPEPPPAPRPIPPLPTREDLLRLSKMDDETIEEDKKLATLSIEKAAPGLSAREVRDIYWQGVEPKDVFDKDELNFLKVMEGRRPVQPAPAQALAQNLGDAYASGDPTISDEKLLLAVMDYFRAYYSDEEDTLEGKYKIYLSTMNACNQAKKERLEVLEERSPKKKKKATKSKKRGNVAMRAILLAAAVGATATAGWVAARRPEASEVTRSTETSRVTLDEVKEEVPEGSLERDEDIMNEQPVGRPGAEPPSISSLGGTTRRQG